MVSTTLVADTARRILRDYCNPQTLNSAKDDAWAMPAWTALEEAGLTLAWVPDGLGGAGADLEDGFGIVREVGRHAAPLPVAETLLAGWLLSKAGIAAPKGAMTCAPVRVGDSVVLRGSGKLSGRLRAVPFAASVSHLAVVAALEGGTGHAIALVALPGGSVTAGRTIAGDVVGEVSLEGLHPAAVDNAPEGIDGHALTVMGAAVRSVQMSGALEAILDIAVSYANERVAFGRPIAKFQAVQHNLARLAGETAVAMAAAGSAAEAIASASPRAFDDPIFLEVASAKIRVGEAAGEGAAIAHQVLGAIGFTKEHVLHRFTQRLWAWRDDFGNESQWAVKLGERVAANGADALWPMLAAR
jgi:alkylation response protein AidB-like acyl-CoA dehydrogenase